MKNPKQINHIDSSNSRESSEYKMLRELTEHNEVISGMIKIFLHNSQELSPNLETYFDISTSWDKVMTLKEEFGEQLVEELVELESICVQDNDFSTRFSTLSDARRILDEVRLLVSWSTPSDKTLLVSRKQNKVHEEWLTVWDLELVQAFMKIALESLEDLASDQKKIDQKFS